MKQFFLFTAVTFLLSSCAAMFGGTKYTANIKAVDHPEATIYVNGAKVGTGSYTGVFERDNDLTIKLREEECEDQDKVYTKQFRVGAFVLSAIAWGPVGMIVDFATGAVWKPDHGNYPEVTKMSNKSYNFNLQYDGCPVDAEEGKRAYLENRDPVWQ